MKDTIAMSPREILEQVKTRIMADPESYNQGSFCGTQCCIAGHIHIVVEGMKKHMALQKWIWREAINEIDSVATAALGETESPWLFGQINTDADDNYYDDDYYDDDNYWPQDLSIEYGQYDQCDYLERAMVGCKAIDRYLEQRGL